MAKVPWPGRFDARFRRVLELHLRCVPIVELKDLIACLNIKLSLPYLSFSSR
jgi:hypothetical protein